MTIASPNAKVPFTSSGDTLSLNALRLMQQMVNALNGTISGDVTMVSLGNGLNVYFGAGEPNGVVKESPGAVYFNSEGGTSATLWVKESGAQTDTGWVGK